MIWLVILHDLGAYVYRGSPGNIEGYTFLIQNDGTMTPTSPHCPDEARQALNERMGKEVAA